MSRKREYVVARAATRASAATPAQSAPRAASAATSPAPVLEVDGYSKRYRDTTVVSGVSLAVPPGRIFGFVGHNGAGKTTLIRSIVGALSFDEGDIRICGQSVRTDPLACKRVTAYVPDSPDVYGFLTGMQYLDYVADLFGVSAENRTRRIADYAGRLGLADRLGEMASAYSHGMRQKLVLIGAFLHEPKLLVLDEPFVGLDPEASFELRGMMHELTGRGGAIFFSSHVLDTVEKLCDEIAIIRHGTIVRIGTVDEVRGDESLEQVFLELAKEARHG